jgi:hypothetical protein
MKTEERVKPSVDDYNSVSAITSWTNFRNQQTHSASFSG